MTLAERAAPLAHPSGSEGPRGALADLRSNLAEKDAEIERLKKQLYDVEAENLQRRAKRSRPDKLRGTTIRKETPLGVMFANITEDDKGQPFEVFVTLGKAGGSAMADVEAMGRLMSLALRSGIPIMEIHRQLRGISSDRAVGLGPNKVLVGAGCDRHRDRRVASRPRDRRAGGAHAADVSGVGRAAAAEMLTSMTHQVPAALRTQGNAAAEMELQFGLHHAAETFIGTCPDCGSQMEYAEGCVKCHVCGFSECG